MIKRLNQERAYLWFALETYGLGIYFLIKQTTFQFQPPRPTIFDLLDDPPAIFILAIAGTLALVYSLWNVDHPLYKPVMTGLLTFVWLFFMIAFGIHDFEAGQYISFQSMYAFFVIGRLLHEIMVGR